MLTTRFINYHSTVAPPTGTLAAISVDGVRNQSAVLTISTGTNASATYTISILGAPDANGPYHTIATATDTTATQLADGSMNTNFLEFPVFPYMNVELVAAGSQLKDVDIWIRE